MVYEIPSAASGAAGLEGFAVEGAAGRAGTVAALNRIADGLALVLETTDGFRALRLGAVARVELLPRRIVLSAEGERELAGASSVEARVVRTETPRLVRHLPRELDRVSVEGEPPSRRGFDPLWVTGTALAAVGGVVLFTGVPLMVERVGGGLAWLWVAVPAAVFALGLVLLWRALAAGHGSGLTRAERAGDAAAFVLGISPPERRRRRRRSRDDSVTHP